MIILNFTLLDVNGFILALGIKAPDFREFIVLRFFLDNILNKKGNITFQFTRNN